MRAFNGVKVFSATMIADRERLGEKVTAWIREHNTYEIADIIITQSSDSAFHCIAITVFYVDPSVQVRATRPTDAQRNAHTHDVMTRPDIARPRGGAR